MSKSGTKLTASWSAPSSNGGSAVTGYTAGYCNITATTDCDEAADWTTAASPGASFTNVTFTVPDAGADYAVRVRAENAVGDGPWVFSAEPPGAPTDLTASAGWSQVTLSWTAGADGGIAVTKHQYRQKADAGAYGGWTDIPDSAPGEANATSYTVEDLINETAYTFQVRAVNAVGGGAESNEASATPECQTGDIWCGTLVAAQSAGFAGYLEALTTGSLAPVTFTYDGTTYTINRILVNSAEALFIGFATAPAAQALDALALHVGDRFFLFKGNASTLVGQYQWNVQSIWPDFTNFVGTHDVYIRTAPTAPGAPRDLSVTKSGDRLAVSWSAPADDGGSAVTGYTVGFCNITTTGCDEAADWTDADVGTDTTATITVADANADYAVRARAENAVGAGPWASTLNSPPEIGGAATRTFTVAENTASGSSVGSAFTATDADNDAITWSLEGTDSASFAIDSGGQLSTAVVLNYEDGSTRSLTVKASDDNGGEDTVAVTVNVTDDDTEAPGKPAAPTLTTAEVTRLTVSWTEPDNAGPPITGYDVRYREGTSGGWSDHAHTGTATSATITGLTASTGYEVQVRATNDEGAGAWSDSLTASTTAPRANSPPEIGGAATRTFTVAENTAIGTDLGAPFTATDPDGDAISWILEGTDSASFAISSGGQLTIAAVLDYEEGSTRSLTVKADDGNGGTDTVEVTVNVTDVTEAPGKPAAPSLSAVSPTSLTVSWWDAPSTTPNTGPPINDYDVRYREGTSGGWTSHAHRGTYGMAMITGLTESTRYQVQLRATNAEGTGPWSDILTASTDGPPPEARELSNPALLQPTDLTVGEGGTEDQGKLSWTPPPVVADGSATFDGQTWYPFSYFVEYWPEGEEGSVKSMTEGRPGLKRPKADLSNREPGDWCARVYVLVRPSPHTTRWGDMKEGDRSDEVCFSIANVASPIVGATISASAHSLDVNGALRLTAGVVTGGDEETGSYTCQFQAQTEDSSKWWDSGPNSAACARTIIKDYEVSYLFRVVVTGADGSTVTSDTVAVSWEHRESGQGGAITELTISASAASVGLGESITLTAHATGDVAAAGRLPVPGAVAR